MILLLSVALGLLQASAETRASIRSVDFKNAPYSWEDFHADPNNKIMPLTWSYKILPGKVRLTRGRHDFVEITDVSPAPYLFFQTAVYGDLDGDGREEAAVDVGYKTDGTASWHYLYVYSINNGRLRQLGILRSGSRSNLGLIRTEIMNGVLITDFLDPDLRRGDCCSDGYIRVRFKLQSSRFVEIGAREKGRLP